jgi:HD-like signal output (HDOD) protein
MAADMIKLANSSKYKRGDKHVTDLQRAFMFMGAEGLKEGILQVFLQNFSASSNLYFKQFGEKFGHMDLMPLNMRKS